MCVVLVEPGLFKWHLTLKTHFRPRRLGPIGRNLPPSIFSLLYHSSVKRVLITSNPFCLSTSMAHSLVALISSSVFPGSGRHEGWRHCDRKGRQSLRHQGGGQPQRNLYIPGCAVVLENVLCGGSSAESGLCQRLGQRNALFALRRLLCAASQERGGDFRRNQGKETGGSGLPATPSKPGNL